jgi:hypothetical protein
MFTKKDRVVPSMTSMLMDPSSRSTAGAESLIVGLTGVTVTEVVEGQITGGGEIYRQLSFGRRNPVL